MTRCVASPATTVAAMTLVLAVTFGIAAFGASTVRVGDRPAAIRARPNERSAVVLTVAAGCELQAFDRERDWVWVVAPAEPGGGGARAGWISQHALVATAAAASTPPPSAGSLAVVAAATPVSSEPSPFTTDTPVSIEAARPSLVALAEAARAESTAARRERAEAAAAAKRGTTRPPASGPGSAPPDPVGGMGSGGQSVLGAWIQPRALRASFGFNYQSAYVRQALGAMDERLRGGFGTIAASLAILDPRILTVDFAGDLQLATTNSRQPLASFRYKNGLASYRLDFGVLTGLKAPLRVFADRVSSNSDLAPSGVTLDPARHTRGVRRDLGFTWDVNADRLPRIQVSASAGRQDDERNYLFGYSSINDEQRAEIRASRDHAHGRYEVDFTHGDFVYDVPAAGVRSETGSDLFQATGRLTPSPRLALDVHARATRFRFGVGDRSSRVSGMGADVAARYRLRENLAAAARYSYSDNAFEAALSGQIGTSQPGATPVTTTAQLQERTRFHDGEARLEYSTQPLTLGAVVKTISFGVPQYLATTLSDLTTGGGLLRLERTWHGVSWHVGADAALGQARSNRAEQQPYREAGAEAGIGRNAAGWVHFGADASVRQIGRLAFFPVNLDARNVNIRLETTRPGWARLRALVTWFDNLRDVLYTDARDRHTGYSLGLAGGRYDISLEVDQADTHSLLLAPAVLGSRPDVAILIASRPELFRGLLAAGDRSRALALQLRPLSGLQIEARARRQDQVYPGLFGVRLKGAQAWATYQIRDVQLEFGWEYFDSATSFGNVRDRRLYFRVRRDLTFF